MLAIYLPNGQKHYPPGSWLEGVVLLVLQRPVFDALSLRLRLIGCERTECTLVGGKKKRAKESLTVRDERPICDLLLTLWGYLNSMVPTKSSSNSRDHKDDIREKKKGKTRHDGDGASGCINFGSSDLIVESVRELSMTSYSVSRLVLEQGLNSGSVDRLVLAEGYHVFPFRLQLPLVRSLPSTFEHKCGQVSYELCASLEFEQRKAVEAVHPIALQTHCTPTSDPSLLQPIERSERRTYFGCCCCGRCFIEVTARCLRPAFVAVGTLHFRVQVNNHTFSYVRGFQLELREVLSFRAKDITVSSSSALESKNSIQLVGPNTNSKPFELEFHLPIREAAPTFAGELIARRYEMFLRVKVIRLKDLLLSFPVTECIALSETGSSYYSF